MKHMRALAAVLCMAMCADSYILKLGTWNSMFYSFPKVLERPSCKWHLRSILNKATKNGERVRVVGGVQHTYGQISMSERGQVAVDMGRLARVLKIDTKKMVVRVQAGCIMHDLLNALDAKDVTLPGVAAVDVQTVGGVIGTSTHGSNTNTSTTVSDALVSLRVMGYNGQIHHIDRQHPHFTAFQANLGLLGIVMDVTLTLIPQYYLHNSFDPVGYSAIDAAYIQNDLDTLTHSVEYVLYPNARLAYADRKNVIPKPVDYADQPRDIDQAARQQSNQLIRMGNLNPEQIPFLFGLAYQSQVNTTNVGKSQEVLAAQNVYEVDVITRQLETEYTLPLSKFDEVFPELLALLEPVADIPIGVEIRTQSTSKALLAMNYGAVHEMLVYIEVVYLNRLDDYRMRPVVEAFMVGHGARPHWGKMNALTHEQVSSLYGDDNVAQFKAVKEVYDPANMFGNSYTDAAFNMGQ